MCVWHCPNLPVAGCTLVSVKVKAHISGEDPRYPQSLESSTNQVGSYEKKLEWVIMYRYVPIPNLKPLS